MEEQRTVEIAGKLTDSDLKRLAVFSALPVGVATAAVSAFGMVLGVEATNVAARISQVQNIAEVAKTLINYSDAIVIIGGLRLFLEYNSQLLAILGPTLAATTLAISGTISLNQVRKRS